MEGRTMSHLDSELVDALIGEAARYIHHVQLRGPAGPAHIVYHGILPPDAGAVAMIPVRVYSPDDLCTLTATLIVSIRGIDVRVRYIDARPEHVRLIQLYNAITPSDADAR